MTESNFLNFFQQSQTFQALSNIKNDKVLFSEFILTIKYCKDYFPNVPAIKNDKVQLSAIKNDKVQISELFPPISPTFRTFFANKNNKVQLSALFPT